MDRLQFAGLNAPRPPRALTPVPLQLARYSFAALAAAAIVAQFLEIMRLGHSILNFFSFFTIESNVIAIVALVSAPRLPMLRGAATCYMMITGIVYMFLLAGVDVDITLPWVNAVLHYVMPFVMLFDWFVFPGEVNTTLASTIVRWTLYPMSYLVYTFARGAVTGWYPYPFFNPRAGLGAVALTVGGILILGIALQYAIFIRARLVYRTSV